MEEKTGVSSMMVCKHELVPSDVYDNQIELSVMDPKTEPVDVKVEEESAGALQSDDSPDDYYNMNEVQTEELSSPEGEKGNKVWDNQQASKKSKVIFCPHCEYSTSEKFLLKSHNRLFHKDKESTGDNQSLKETQSPADIDPESIPISSEEYLISLIQDEGQSRNNNALTIDAPKSPGSEYIPSFDELDSDEETSEVEGASEDELFAFKTKGAKRHYEPAPTQADK